MLTEGHGVPIGAVIEGANCHDMKLVRSTIQNIIIERPRPTEEHPQGMCLDKGYDYDEVYTTLLEFGFTAHVRMLREEAQAIKREAGGLRAPLDGGASPFLAQSLSPPTRSVGEKAAELSGVSPFRLQLDRFSGRRVIRIISSIEESGCSRSCQECTHAKLQRTQLQFELLVREPRRGRS
jgi:hypothetical protein